MSRRRLLLFSLLVVAAWLALFGDKTPPDGPTVAVVAPAPAKDGRASGSRSSGAAASANRPANGLTAASRRAGPADASVEVLALIPREQLISNAADARSSRDLFPSLNWTPPPLAPARSLDHPSPPPPPLMAPPLSFVYLGKKLEAGSWEVYLGRGEQVFIAREGMTLDNKYRVKAITSSSLTLIFLPLKQAQTLSIGEAP